jgi:hypothetical protein
LSFKVKVYRKSIVQYISFVTGELGLPEDTRGYQSHRTCPAWPEAYKRQEGREPSGTGQGILLHGQRGLLEENRKYPVQGVLGNLYFYV